MAAAEADVAVTAASASSATRTLEDVNEILENAKLDAKDLLGVTQEISFDSNFTGRELRLIELDPEITESIVVGTRLVLRGDPNDLAVLCTDKSTFEIKEAETSNSLLILENLVFPDEAKTSPTKSMDNDAFTRAAAEAIRNCEHDEDERVIQHRSVLSVAHSYLELSRIKPNLRKIYQVLEPSVYKGDLELIEMDDSISVPEPISLDQLLDRVPASVAEIEKFLKENLRTVEIDGKIRLMDDDYLFQILSQVLDYIDSQSWNRTNVSMESVIQFLNELHPEFILRKIFDWFFFRNQPAATEESESTGELVMDVQDEEIYSMNEYEISRFLGEVILRTGKRFKLSDFLEAWKQSVPNGIKVSVNQLEGLAVINKDLNPPAIWYFSSLSMPDSIPDRFQILFETKSKWKLEEILPYIQDCVVSVQSAGNLLTKYSRVHTINGTKYYSAKHSK